MSPLSYKTSLLPNYSQLHSHISVESTAMQVQVNHKAGRKHIKGEVWVQAPEKNPQTSENHWSKTDVVLTVAVVSLSIWHSLKA